MLPIFFDIPPVISQVVVDCDENPRSCFPEDRVGFFFGGEFIANVDERDSGRVYKSISILIQA
jgi:hypothetical protein